MRILCIQQVVDTGNVEHLQSMGIPNRRHQRWVRRWGQDFSAVETIKETLMGDDAIAR